MLEFTLLKNHTSVMSFEKVLFQQFILQDIQTPYKFDVCGKSFAQTNAFTKHARIPTSERPYKCDVCGNSFISAGHLTRHAINHTGEKHSSVMSVEKVLFKVLLQCMLEFTLVTNDTSV